MIPATTLKAADGAWFTVPDSILEDRDLHKKHGDELAKAVEALRATNMDLIRENVELHKLAAGPEVESMTSYAEMAKFRRWFLDADAENVELRATNKHLQEQNAQLEERDELD